MACFESIELRVLILAPSGRDARLAEETLGRSGLSTVVCADFERLCSEIAPGAGAALIAEEALPRAAGSSEVLIGPEPAWSCLPLVILAKHSTLAHRLAALRDLERRANVSFLERPVPKRTLVSTVRAALEARRRQYAVRDLLEERAVLLARVEEQLDQMQVLYDAAPIGLAMLDRELRFERVNPVLAEINGASIAEHLGRKAWDIVPGLRESAERPLRQVLETGRTVSGVEVSGETPAQPGVRREWLERFYPVKGLDGTINGIGIIVEEVTERRRAEERQAMLTAELHHRVKNMLSTVQAMAVQTLSSSESMEEFSEAFSGRLRALAQGHDLLLSSHWQPTTVSTLLHNALKPFLAAEQIPDCEGDAWLQPKGAMAFNLIFHELTTNAAKYGALSVPDGRIDVSCSQSLDEPGMAVFQWTEHDGPPVTPPRRRGFGSRLIERCAQHELGGDAQLTYDRGGLQCVIRFVPGEPYDHANG